MEGEKTRRRLSEADRDRIVEGYRAWDPAEETVDHLVHSLGVSKQTLYTVLRDRGEPFKTAYGRQGGVQVEADQATMDGIAKRLAEVMVARLEEQAAEIERIGALYEELYAAAVDAEAGDLRALRRHLRRARA